MILYLTERKKLYQAEVNYVQKGQFKNNVDRIDNHSITGITDIIYLSYMGSYEFECGSLPGSLRRMTINKDFYKVFVFDQYKDENGNSLKVYAPIIFYKNIHRIVDRLVEYGYGLQEYCSLCEHVQIEHKDECDAYRKHKDGSDFWWDIDNDFFMFFEHTDKVIAAMNALRNRKFGYEDERNIPKSVLTKYYLDKLTYPNTNRFYDRGTSIKICNYDKESNTYNIEFLDKASLEDILMEAIIIAKVSEDIVSFSINGIPFTINSEALHDIVVSENGIDMIDSETYKNMVNELISWYNEELQREEEQLKLITVLKRIKDKKEKSHN